jgi:fumarate reductase flavoprotein subunit
VVLAQPGGVAFDVIDQRLLALGRSFPDFVDAEAAGAVRHAADVPTLARLIGCDEPTLAATLAGTRLVPPYAAIKVTGALFHTQGGLDIDARCRVLRDDSAFTNLWLPAAPRGVYRATPCGAICRQRPAPARWPAYIAAHTAAHQIGETP